MAPQLPLAVVRRGACRAVKSFVSNDEGQDLLEYALLVALIALVAVAAVTAAGTSVSTIFTSIAGKLTAATPSS